MKDKMPKEPTIRKSTGKNRQAEIAGKAIARNVVLITNQMINQAAEGDVRSAELVLSRILPKGRLVKFPIPPIERPEDVRMAIAGFINAVAAGILTVDEAEKLVNMSVKLGDAIDATEHAEILKQLADKSGITINDTL
jgi:hypothetical protein